MWIYFRACIFRRFELLSSFWCSEMRSLSSGRRGLNGTWVPCWNGNVRETCFRALCVQRLGDYRKVLFTKQQGSMGHHPWKRGCMCEINLLQKLKPIGVLWFQLSERKLWWAWGVTSCLTFSFVLRQHLQAQHSDFCSPWRSQCIRQSVRASQKLFWLFGKQNGYRTLSEKDVCSRYLLPKDRKSVV